MSPFNYCTLFLLLSCIVLVICKTSDEVDIGYDVPSTRGRYHSRLHGNAPSVARTKRPRKIHNRDGGSRFLARGNKKNGKKKLDRSAFLSILGEDFNESWMTYQEPKKKTLISIPQEEIRNLTAIKGSWAPTELESELARLNLTSDLQRYAPELLPHEALIREYLMKRSTCEVEYTWKDLGNKYWPRWVREGECKERDGLCSFPPGMVCVPGVSTVVYLLHWECSKEVDRASRSAIPVEAYYLQYLRPVVPELDRNGKTRNVDDVFNPPRMETSVLYKKPVPTLPPAPIHLPRKKKRCRWNKVPHVITIDCYCAC